MPRPGDESEYLSILNALQEDDQLSQRGLAKVTGMNLAKINFCLKKLVDKGFIKLKNISKNQHKLRYLYLITPDGFKAKSKLTYKFIQRTLSIYNEFEKTILKTTNRLVENNHYNIILYGLNDITKIFCSLVDNNESLNVLNINAIVDNSKAGDYYKKIPIIDPDEIYLFDNIDKIVICIEDDPNNQLLKLENEDEYLNKLYWLV